MLIVMPNGSLPRPANLPPLVPGTTPSPEVAAAMAASQARFTSELMKDVVPFVEKTYRVRADARSRAIAGLSMGGGQTQRVLVTHPDAFAYVAIWSAGVRPEGTEAFEKDAASFLAAPEKANTAIRLLSIRVGREGLRPARLPKPRRAAHEAQDRARAPGQRRRPHLDQLAALPQRAAAPTLPLGTTNGGES